MQIPDVPPQLLSALVQAAEGQRLALVGGVVRDLLLHRHHQDPWRGLPDLDLVVEGRAADLVERLPKALEHHLGVPVPLRQQHHGRYGTVALELQLPPEQGGTWLLDLASARQEVYTTAGDNPQVSPGSLEQDLSRRDFSVNAMALLLPSILTTEVKLLDPHGGQRDLEDRQLRFLHANSLRDDPTRLVRAARYAARLKFDLAPDARWQAQATISAWPWPWHFGSDLSTVPPALGTRLGMELELLLNNEFWQMGMQSLQSWGAMNLIDPGLQNDLSWHRRIVWARRFNLPLMMAFIVGATEPIKLAQRLQLPHVQQRIINQSQNLRNRLEDTSMLPQKPSEWSEFLETSVRSPLAVALLLTSGYIPRRPLLHWYVHWRHCKSPENASELIQQGWLPGPNLGHEIKRLRMKALDEKYYE